MTRFTTYFLALCSTVIFETQGQEVISTSGWSGRIGDLYIEASLGEFATMSFVSSAGVIFQGVLQPRIPIITSKRELIDGAIKVFPNPFTEELTVIDELKRGTFIEVKNIQGYTLYSQQLSVSSILNLNQLTLGVYLLNVYDEEKRRIGVYQIIKF